MTTRSRPASAGVPVTARIARPRHAAVPRRACPECGERLSAYNPGPYCYAHTVGVPWKGPNQPG